MKKWLFILMIGLTLGTVFTGKAQKNNQKTNEGCVQSAAYQLMLKGLLSHSTPILCPDSAVLLDSSVVFLDAREPNETKVSTINNSIAVGYDHFNMKTVKHLPKNKKIIVYCSVGYRSEKIAEKLIQAGYTNVYNLYGGIFEWVNQGNPIVNSDSTTTNVHAFNKVWGVWLTNGTKVYGK